MSVLIKDMAMPKSCKECPLKLGSPDGVTCLVKDWWWTFDYTRPDWCPLEEVKEEDKEHERPYQQAGGIR